MKPEAVILIKVKSCSALLRLVLLCIRSYLKSFTRYKFFTTVNILHNVWVLHEVKILQFVISTGYYFDHLSKAI
jgi:hypothetical protein